MCADLDRDMTVMMMEIEERFGLTIADAEAEKIRTMGQLYDFVHAHVARGQAQVCVTSAAFYRVRRALGEVCAVPRERVRTHDRLEDLVPLPGRQQRWQELRARLGNLYFPSLCRPAWLVRRIELVSQVPLFLAVLCTIVAIAVFAHTPAAPLVVMLAVLGCPLVGILGMFLVCGVAYRRTEHYAVHIPPGCATVRDLVYTLVSRHPAPPMVSGTARANNKEMWGTLCAIIGRAFERAPQSFTRDSTFD